MLSVFPTLGVSSCRICHFLPFPPSLLSGTPSYVAREDPREGGVQTGGPKGERQRTTVSYTGEGLLGWLLGSGVAVITCYGV